MILVLLSQILALANLYPEQPQVDDLDSFMFQTVSRNATANETMILP